MIVASTFAFCGFVALKMLGTQQMKEQLADLYAMPMTVVYGITIWSFVATLLSGIFMLKGEAWARLLYSFYTPTGMLINWSMLPQGRPTLVLQLVFYIVVMVFLFRPNANAFFKGDVPEPEGDREGS
jgi:hypothetical protein